MISNEESHIIGYFILVKPELKQSLLDTVTEFLKKVHLGINSVRLSYETDYRVSFKEEGDVIIIYYEGSQDLYMKIFSYGDVVSVKTVTFHDLPRTEELYLRDKKITEIPKKISALLNLKILDMGYNLITSIPVEIGLLSNLRILNLNSNRIITIPKEIVLAEVEELYLGDNQILEFPVEIGNLQSLQTWI